MKFVLVNICVITLLFIQSVMQVVVDYVVFPIWPHDVTVVSQFLWIIKDTMITKVLYYLTITVTWWKAPGHKMWNRATFSLILAVLITAALEISTYQSLNFFKLLLLFFFFVVVIPDDHSFTWLSLCKVLE